MQRITVAAVTAATFATVILTGCADGNDGPSCDEDRIVFTENDGQYHCMVGGQVIFDVDLPDRVKARSGYKPPASAPKAGR